MPSVAPSTQSVRWLENASFDLVCFHLSGLAMLLFLIPYVDKGESTIIPIYNFYLVFLGLPHNYLTWATILPPTSQKTFNMKPVWFAATVCVALCVLIPLTRGMAVNDWILSLIAYFSLWHTYRQHHGICKVYDAVQAKRTGDGSVFSDRAALNWFFALGLNAVLVWAFTREKIEYLVSADEKYTFIHPHIPWIDYQIYVAVTILVGVYAFKRAVFDRRRGGKFVPWPQISLMICALATYLVPYFFIPISAMPLAVAVGAMFHDVQYFGFVWLFERERSQELRAASVSLGLPQRLAFNNGWARYFGLALAYSFMVIAIYLSTPRAIGLTLIYFLAIVHYVVDGYIWRRNHNQYLTPVIARWASLRTISTKGVI
jgi:hypothetical protein